MDSMEQFMFLSPQQSSRSESVRDSKQLQQQKQFLKQQVDQPRIQQSEYPHTFIRPCSDIYDQQIKQIEKNKKGKYIHKLKAMRPDFDSQSKLDNSEHNSKRNVQDKKQRNRKLARQTRQRKKIYNSLMDQKKKGLEMQIASKNREIEQAEKYFQKIKTQNQIMSSFAQGRQSLVKRLEILVQQWQNIQKCNINYKPTLNENEKSQKIDKINKEINEIIDTLKIKVGASGKQRIETIDEYLTQIINLSLPAIHRYIIWTASNGIHMFANQIQRNPVVKNQWFSQMKNNMGLNEQQVRQMSKKRGLFIEYKQKLMELVSSLRQKKNNIFQRSNQLQSMLDQVRQILNPIQWARTIIFIQKNKYRKQLNISGQDSHVDIKTEGKY